jgi:SagB-type dehydrogenase family enzyme
MTTTAHAFLDAVVNRSTHGMEPEGFQINWLDAPRKGKFFAGAEQINLDRVVPDDDAAAQFSLPVLADLLKATYAEGDRRLALHCNNDVDDLPRYGRGSLARGTASGGARYPISIYWIAGPDTEATPGVYYYNVYHHALQRILTGDQTSRVARAIGSPQVAAQYLVLGLKYWQNAFKYHNFCFQAVSMDLGTVTESWRSWLGDRGLSVLPHLWFDEQDLGRLLSVDLDEEGIFAVLPLGEATRSTPRDIPDEVSTFGTDTERSRSVIAFPMTVGMQRATSAHSTARPQPSALRSAAPAPVPSGPFIPLAPAEAPGCGGAESLRRRRSSFGRFVDEPLRQSALAGLLEEAMAAAAYPCDASGGEDLDLMSLYVFVNHIEDVPPGSYRYDPVNKGLVSLVDGPPGQFLQTHYALDNYNVEQCGAVIVPAVRGHALIDATGDRGYRLMSAVVGAATQRLYQAAAARPGVGCGAALGFDNAAYIEHLGLAGSDTVPLIIVMVGVERAGHANFRSEIH